MVFEDWFQTIASTGVNNHGKHSLELIKMKTGTNCQGDSRFHGTSLCSFLNLLCELVPVSGLRTVHGPSKTAGDFLTWGFPGSMRSTSHRGHLNIDAASMDSVLAVHQRSLNVTCVTAVEPCTDGHISPVL